MILPYPETLQEVQVPIVSNKNCANIYGHEVITDNMVCAGLTEGGKDSCQVRNQAHHIMSGHSSVTW